MTTSRLFQPRTCIVVFLLVCILLVPSCPAASQRTITVTSSSATVQVTSVDSVNMTAKYLDQSGTPLFEEDIILELGDATSSVRSGFTPDPVMGGFDPGRTSTITLTTGEKGCVTRPSWEGVMPEFGYTRKWVWVYSATIPTVYGKKTIDPTCPRKVNIKAMYPSILANLVDRTTIMVWVFDNKGKPFNSTRVRVFVNEVPWTAEHNRELYGEGLQEVNGNPTNRNGMAWLTFGWGTKPLPGPRRPSRHALPTVPRSIPAQKSSSRPRNHLPFRRSHPGIQVPGSPLYSRQLERGCATMTRSY